MSWWGKVIGGTFGFMLGGPLGALLGAALGHNFDTGVKNLAGGSVYRREQVQTAFFTAVFSVMGYISKADGHISKSEIVMAEQVMRNMRLSREQRKFAIELFNQGKQANFPLREIIRQLNQELGPKSNLKRIFLEIEITAAFADGVLHTNEERELLQIADWLYFPRSEFKYLIGMIKANRQSDQPARARKQISLEDAYTVLNVASTASISEIKKAYRRLLSQHHPDKLVAKGLPEEMMKVAADKTHQIKQAYEQIRLDRNF